MESTTPAKKRLTKLEQEDSESLNQWMIILKKEKILKMAYYFKFFQLTKPSNMCSPLKKAEFLTEITAFSSDKKADDDFEQLSVFQKVTMDEAERATQTLPIFSED